MDIEVASAVWGAAGLAVGLGIGVWAGQRARHARAAKLQGTPLPPMVAGEPAPLQSQLHTEPANHAKDEFLANISHEIRTPLTAILGFTDLLLRGGEDEARRREYLTLIRRSGKHLLDLINDVLDLSKIKAGKMRIRPVECSVHEVICDVVALSRLAADQRQLDLKYVWNGPIPQRVCTDPARFRQLVTNLLGNALKFTERGGVTVSLEMLDAAGDKGQPSRRMLAVRVADTGIGISRDKLAEIFEPFNQADTTVTRRYGGTGLGLTITREIVRSLGGRLTVSSQPGVGSTFTATIDPGPLDGVPMIKEKPSCDGVSPLGVAARAVSTLAEDLAGVRVLLVEDGDVNRRLIAAMLAETGAQVDTAENGCVGIERVLATNYDVILMDMQMPVLDGFRATAELRRLGLTVPIIALTAHAMSAELERCQQVGCSACLSKPVDVATLLRTLHEALDAASPVSAAPESEAQRTVDVVFSHGSESLKSSLPAKFNDIVCRFVPQLKQLVHDLRTAFDQRDLTTMRRLTHALRGSAGTAGFHCFTTPSQRMSQALNAMDWAQAAVALEEIERMAERVVSPTTDDACSGPEGAPCGE